MHAHAMKLERGFKISKTNECYLRSVQNVTKNDIRIKPTSIFVEDPAFTGKKPESLAAAVTATFEDQAISVKLAMREAIMQQSVN